MKKGNAYPGYPSVPRAPSPPHRLLDSTFFVPWVGVGHKGGEVRMHPIIVLTEVTQVTFFEQCIYCGLSHNRFYTHWMYLKSSGICEQQTNNQRRLVRKKARKKIPLINVGRLYLPFESKLVRCGGMISTLWLSMFWVVKISSPGFFLESQTLVVSTSRFCWECIGEFDNSQQNINFRPTSSLFWLLVAKKSVLK